MIVPLLIGVAVIDPAVAAANPVGSAGGANREAAHAAAPATGAAASTASGRATSSGTTASNPVDPDYPYAGDLKSTITGITPSVVTATAGDLMTVTGTVKNVSKGELYDLRYVWQRGDALSTVKAVKTEIATPSRPSAVIGQDWKVLSAKPIATTAQADLAAGASMRFVATVAISDADGLALTQRGVYPLMIKISGDIGQNGATQYERVGEIHLLASVLSIPAARPATGPPSTVSPPGDSGSGTGALGTDALATPGSTTGQSATEQTTTEQTTTGQSSSPGEAVPATTSTTDIPTQGFPTTPTTVSTTAAADVPATGTGAQSSVSVSSTATSATTPTATTAPPTTSSPTSAHPVVLNQLWPLVDGPHIGVGGVFLNDRLAADIAPGGRLGVILTDLMTLNTGASSTTVVVDPELLEEIQQMSVGYRVMANPGLPQPALTPVTTTPGTSTPATPASATSTPHPRPHPHPLHRPRRLPPPRPSRSRHRCLPPVRPFPPVRHLPPRDLARRREDAGDRH